MIIITNEGIQIIKEIPDELKCEDCAEFNFCPRGPVQDFCIKYSAIETIVNFP